jgi:hypothetical protein
VYVDKLVIADHPAIYDRHVIGKVVTQTAKTVSIIYWSNMRREWKEDAVKRVIRPANLRILHEDAATLSDADVSAIGDKIEAAARAFREAEGKAKTAYIETIRAITA